MTSAQPLVPTRLPANGQDVFNYLAGEYASNHQIHLVITFEAHLDAGILAAAIRHIMDAEPVLGCRFVEHPQAAYWERRQDLDALNLCPVVETVQPEEDLRAFIAQATDSRHDLQLQAKIFREQDRDLLCLKVDHASVDGGGVKTCASLLSRLYSLLCEGQRPTLSDQIPRRDVEPYLEKLGIKDPRQAWDPTKMPPPPTWSFPSRQQQNREPFFLTRSFGAAQFQALKGYAKGRGATINDLLLTACYRALFALTGTPEHQPQPLRLTVDLRDRMPEGNRPVAANVSSAFDALFPFVAGESFFDTLARLSRQIALMKQSQAEVPIALLFELFGMMPFTETKGWFDRSRNQVLDTKHATPHLSNIGIIEPLAFGPHTASQAYVVTPAMFAPGFMLGVSTYQQVMTLVVHAYASDVDKRDMQDFLDKIVEDLLPSTT
ncbi:hypothetical protein GTO91_07595 [Heliobacterium undosum]|uniref:Condensation domain-containing protein n=1 Tax=Heliomicrobium undosum TaxID=121734 RepID=A0A845L757_9FIRM|nr:condensation domain-containing protein [Heliomicrobium undosum]MZP29568.1 hypothetical protein [Heliomicrobium undosum]